MKEMFIFRQIMFPQFPQEDFFTSLDRQLRLGDRWNPEPWRGRRSVCLTIFVKIKLIINQDVIFTQISSPLMRGVEHRGSTDTLRLHVTVQLWWIVVVQSTQTYHSEVLILPPFHFVAKLMPFFSGWRKWHIFVLLWYTHKKQSPVLRESISLGTALLNCDSQQWNPSSGDWEGIMLYSYAELDWYPITTLWSHAYITPLLYH